MSVSVFLSFYVDNSPLKGRREQTTLTLIYLQAVGCGTFKLKCVEERDEN